MIAAKLHTPTGVSDLASDRWYEHCINGSYLGFIFDCDGTLVESEDVHFEAFRLAILEQEALLERDWYFTRTGLDRSSLIREFSSNYHPNLDIEQAIERSISIFIETSFRVKPIEQTANLVRDLAGEYPLAVGTNAEQSVARASLTATGMIQHFDHIVSISDGCLPKPSPEIFKKAASLLAVAPAQTLVIEDSAQGVKAALTAGMNVIEITSIDR